MAGTIAINVVVKVSSNFAEVCRRLRVKGMRVAHEFESIKVVNGSADREVLPRLRRLQGIVGIYRVLQVKEAKPTLH